MDGKALTGWILLVSALAIAVLISIGLYNWDARARQEEASLRPQPLAPLAAPPPTMLALPTLASPPVARASGDATVGKATFLKTCFGCHPNGNAAIGPALYGTAFSARYPDNAALEAVIRGGRGGMPAFNSSQLTDDDLANIIAYVRSLAAAPVAAPAGAPVIAVPSPAASAAAGTPAPLSQETLSRVSPGLSSFMLETAKRMGRAWFAGQANNWDEAAFEVREARGVVQAGAARSNTARQQALLAFNDAFLTPLATAAQSGDAVQFQQSYRTAIQACNACHSAQAYGPTGGTLSFIRVQVPTSSIWDVYAYGK
jgi:mono/diheme cytochrome c family protein